MELPTYFTDFLQTIRPTPNQVDDYKCGHQTLRQRLREDAVLSPILVSTFLQGSYRRATAIRPQAGKRSDVDVIVVTRLSKDEYTPAQAQEVFVPFLEKHYRGKYQKQGRSIGIELSYVDIDLVITAAPSESEVGILQAESVTTEDTPEDVDDWRLTKSWVERAHRGLPDASLRLKAAQQEPEWKLAPLSIPDRDANTWEATHPLAQIKWTWEKNKHCNGHYVNVVKALKWWRRVKLSTLQYPKGYPVEHLIGQCCPYGITSVAEGVTRTLETIAWDYQSYALLKQTPPFFLSDHGAPDHNVFHRLSGEDFAEFHRFVCEAVAIARQALDEPDDVRASVEKWQALFGPSFPDAHPDESKGGYTARERVSVIGGGRFA
jgi:Second Messenger Oligonucleotide or Dinucleotide Synthetase domain